MRWSSPIESRTKRANSQEANGVSEWDDGYEADDNGNAEYLRALYPAHFLFTPSLGWMKYTGTHWQTGANAAVTQAAIGALKQRHQTAREEVASQAIQEIAAWDTLGNGNGSHDGNIGHGDIRMLGLNAKERMVEALKRKLVKAADPQSKVAQVVKATLANDSRVRGCINLFQSYVTEPDVRTFDSDPDLLNCQNGVLNLCSGELTPHSPRQRFTYCLPVEYDPQADMSEVLHFISEAVDNREVASYLQVCVGYSLTGHTREEKLFYPFGPSRAGKGTFVESLLALLPPPLSTEADFTSFTARRDGDSQNFDLAGLRPARLVVASESNRSQSLNPAKIKQLTGGDDIRAAFKHKDMFTYRPQFKVWLVSNHEVNGDPDDDALWGRVQVIHFPHSHLGREDTGLKQRLRSPENLRGWLRWAQEGAARWYQEGLHAPECVLLATQAQRDGQDSIKQWIDDCCELDATQWAASNELLASYRAWCEDNHVQPGTANDLARALTKRFGCVQQRAGRRKEQQRGYHGIRLLASPGEPSEQSGRQ